MKKNLAIAIATGCLIGGAIMSAPGQAVPVSRQIIEGQNIAQRRPSPVVQQQQNQNPQADWDVPDISQADSDIKPVVSDDGKPVIQVALLLDTSGSMSSLIDQAKTELWSIVNKLGKAKYKGQTPTIEVALYEYGKSTLARDEGYIRQIAPFTNDLDGLSESLFALRTNGGDEYCAWVIRSALDSLKWKHRKGALRMVFVAGNESFDQGPVETNDVLKEANSKGVLVHPIYCSNGNSSDKVSWNTAAQLAHTDLKVIDHTRVAKIPKTPYDEKIRDLGGRLNKTYIGYGAEGRSKMARQSAQDSNMAVVSPAAAAERSVTKAGSSYQNDDWDVVDKAKASGGVANIATSELPEEMKKMSVQEREAFVAKKAQERNQIQAEIRELNKKREQFIAQKQAEAPEGDVTLGRAVIETVKDKAIKEGFTL